VDPFDGALELREEIVGFAIGWRSAASERLAEKPVARRRIAPGEPRSTRIVVVSFSSCIRSC
jgi:hypothetical protein